MAGVAAVGGVRRAWNQLLFPRLQCSSLPPRPHHCLLLCLASLASVSLGTDMNMATPKCRHRERETQLSHHGNGTSQGGNLIGPAWVTHLPWSHQL